MRPSVPAHGDTGGDQQADDDGGHQERETEEVHPTTIRLRGFRIAVCVM
jgi:hypothetical protein